MKIKFYLEDEDVSVEQLTPTRTLKKFKKHAVDTPLDERVTERPRQKVSRSTPRKNNGLL